MSEGVAPTTAELASLVTGLGVMAPALDDGDRIERIRQLENLKAAAAAAQARETAAFAVSQKAMQAVSGVPCAQQGRGVAAQIGLARRISPWQAQRYTGWAAILTTELPHTFAALQAGRITEWRAMIIARETIWLTRDQRATVDTELAGQLAGWGDARVEAEARKAAYRFDPAGSLARTRGVANDRRVTVRPAPDTMARLTAYLPVAQAIAAYAALCRAADLTTAGGDERGRGQIMADTLVQRLTGQAAADAVPVEIELVMTDTTLFGHNRTDSADLDTDLDTDVPATGTDQQVSDEQVGDGPVFDEPVSDEQVSDEQGGDEPGFLVGVGPIPAGVARELALGTSDTDQARRRIRRLFRHPTTGQLAAMDTTARLFTRNERRFIRYRDHGVCRTPWCGAPIRHTDHIKPYSQGGPTSVVNAQGLCAACNYARQAARWHSDVDPDGTITTRTPTGHRYVSRVPDPPGSPPPGESPLERQLRALLAVA